jgi:hypothetical protein
MLSNEFIINEIDKYIYVITQIKVMSLYVSIQTICLFWLTMIL